MFALKFDFIDPFKYYPLPTLPPIGGGNTNLSNSHLVNVYRYLERAPRYTSPAQANGRVIWAAALDPKSAGKHLKWDLARRFIEIVPGEDHSSPPIARAGPLAGVYPGDIIKLLVNKNPKSPNSRAFQIYNLYRDGMYVGEFLAAHSSYEFLTAFNDATPIIKKGRVPQRRHDLLPGIDRHSHWARRVRSILSTHISDLGGIDACSAAELSVLRRVAVLSIEMERLERRFATFEPDHIAYRDLDVYSRLANTLRRMLDLTGLERRDAKTLVPTIDAYVAARADNDADPVIDIPDPATMQEAAE